MDNWDKRRVGLMACFGLTDANMKKFQQYYHWEYDEAELSEYPKLDEFDPELDIEKKGRRGHAVSVRDRYRLDDGTVVWELKNSWGTKCAKRGFFKVIDGKLPLKFHAVWCE